MVNRRSFLRQMAVVSAGTAAMQGDILNAFSAGKPLFQISLAQWSFHKALQAGRMDNLDFAKITKREFGIDAVEYVNQFFKDKAKDKTYLQDMKKRAGDEGVKGLLIMCDGEGRLGDPDAGKRKQAVENHYKWVEAAKFLGCHAIRVNAGSAGAYADQMKLAADGLRKLSEFGAQHGLNVIVENHGGLSSDAKWLVGVMKTVDHPNCGTLPDFGNFVIDSVKDISYDRYKGVEELMPYARAVSAKSHDFDAQGLEIHTDYFRMMKIVLEAGYSGYVGIEYEGSELSEHDGIRATHKLLKMVAARARRVVVYE